MGSLGPPLDEGMERLPRLYGAKVLPSRGVAVSARANLFTAFYPIHFGAGFGNFAMFLIVFKTGLFWASRDC
jgi:hypothetical protein